MNTLTNERLDLNGVEIIHDIVPVDMCIYLEQLVYNQIKNNPNKCEIFKTETINDQNRDHGTLPGDDEVVCEVISNVLSVFGSSLREYLIHENYLSLVELCYLKVSPGSKPQGPHRDIDPTLPGTCVTFLVYLTECNKENGATEVFPNTRVKDGVGYHVGPEQLSDMRHITATADRGSVLVYDVETMHYGNANTTNSDRIVMAFTFGESVKNVVDNTSTTDQYKQATKHGRSFLLDATARDKNIYTYIK